MKRFSIEALNKGKKFMTRDGRDKSMIVTIDTIAEAAGISIDEVKEHIKKHVFRPDRLLSVALYVAECHRTTFYKPFEQVMAEKNLPKAR